MIGFRKPAAEENPARERIPAPVLSWLDGLFAEQCKAARKVDDDCRKRIAPVQARLDAIDARRERLQEDARRAGQWLASIPVDASPSAIAQHTAVVDSSPARLQQLAEDRATAHADMQRLEAERVRKIDQLQNAMRAAILTTAQYLPHVVGSVWEGLK